MTGAERFTVTLTADELAHLVTAYRFMRHESEMPSAFDALNAAKPVRARATSTARPAGGYSPNTGDSAVDAFMRRKHNPKYKPLPLPKSPGLPPLRPLKVSEQYAAEAAWKRACGAARATVAEGKPSEAETVLRTLIATHRNPWRHEATEGTPPNAVRILTSPRHPGVAIHEIREAGEFSSTWRVMAGGVLSEKKHYAMQAAELEADSLT